MSRRTATFTRPRETAAETTVRAGFSSSASSRGRFTATSSCLRFTEEHSTLQVTPSLWASPRPNPVMLFIAIRWSGISPLAKPCMTAGAFPEISGLQHRAGSLVSTSLWQKRHSEKVSAHSSQPPRLGRALRVFRRWPSRPRVTSCNAWRRTRSFPVRCSRARSSKPTSSASSWSPSASTASSSR